MDTFEEIRGVKCTCQEIPKSLLQTRVLAGTGRQFTSQGNRRTSEGKGHGALLRSRDARRN